jgi:hypothetical protein
MQIEIRLVCPDPNCNKAQILDPDSMNPVPKQSHRYRYVPVCGSRYVLISGSIRTDDLRRYRYSFSGSGTYTVSPDPDPKYSYRYVRYVYSFWDPDSMNAD